MRSGNIPKIPSFFSHEWFEKRSDEDELWLNMLLSKQTWSKDACSCQNWWNDLHSCGWCRHMCKITRKGPKPPDLLEIPANKKVPPSNFGWGVPGMRELRLRLQISRGWWQQRSGFPPFQHWCKDGFKSGKVSEAFLSASRHSFSIVGSLFGIYMVCSVVS